MDRPPPIGQDITGKVIDRLSSHILSKENIADETEFVEKAFLLPVLEESVAQYQATHKRGFVLCHRIASPYGFYYVEQADRQRCASRRSLSRESEASWNGSRL